MIYTSYFGNLRNIPKNIFRIAISRTSPIWNKHRPPTYNYLVPTQMDLFAYRVDNDAGVYANNYRENVLSKLNPDDVVKDLYDLSNGRDVVLLCYEKPPRFCHRQIVAKWLNDAGYPCTEL